MDQPLPLPTLLSQVLVAFTIEFDNEFERQMPHRTTRHGSTGGLPRAPWLVSLAMWENCMRYVGEEGVTVGELEKLARTPTNLRGMERWRYVTVEPKPLRRNWVIHAKPGGRKAQQIWRPLFGIIEERWQERFGQTEIDRLKQSLRNLTGQLNFELSDCLPIVGYGLFTGGPDRELPATAGRKPADAPADANDNGGSPLSLSALLARVLLAFALEFESESEVSLAMGANVLRVLDEEGVPARELPRLTGVSKEAVKISVGWLEKRGYLNGGKLVRLTPAGLAAQRGFRQRLGAIEKRWLARFGKDVIGSLRESLDRLAGNPTAALSPLFRGLEPYPDGWRASVPKPEVLPHYPMVSHRGGFPDGS